MWRKNCYMEKFWKILGNFGRFCHNLPAFMWRKIEPKKFICGEKMTNMSSAILVDIIVKNVNFSPIRLADHPNPWDTWSNIFKYDENNHKELGSKPVFLLPCILPDRLYLANRRCENKSHSAIALLFRAHWSLWRCYGVRCLLSWPLSCRWLSPQCSSVSARSSFLSTSCGSFWSLRWVFMESSLLV